MLHYAAVRKTVYGAVVWCSAVKTARRRARGIRISNGRNTTPDPIEWMDGEGSATRPTDAIVVVGQFGRRRGGRPT